MRNYQERKRINDAFETKKTAFEKLIEQTQPGKARELQYTLDFGFYSSTVKYRLN